MPEFKTLEEKFLFDFAKAEEEIEEMKNKNELLEGDIELLKEEIQKHVQREELFKELLSLLKVRFRPCVSGDQPLLDADALYPFESEKYARMQQIVSELNLEIEKIDKEQFPNEK